MKRIRTLAFIVCLFAAIFLPGCRGGTRSGRTDRPNIVVFLLDAARADHFGCYGYAPDTTPNIDSLAGTGVIFDAVFSEAASTFPSTAALMTGLGTRESGLWKTQPVPESFELLAEKAKRSGYRTYAYSENPFVTSAFGFERGFSVFQEAFPHEAFSDQKGELPTFDSSEHIHRALEWFAQSPEEPFFAYFHILRPHNPYTPPAPTAQRFAEAAEGTSAGATDALLEIDSGNRVVSEGELARIIALYDANLAYGDELFGALLAGMREQSLLDESVVIVLSDHGEGFLEHGRMLHTSTVFDEMIHVPLIVRFPEGGNGGRIGTPIQLRDVGRGIARLLEAGPDSPRPDESVFLPRARTASGMSDPATTAIGDSGSWTISRTLPRFGVAAVRTERHKLLLEIGADGCTAIPGALYDLKRDPEERSPLPTAENSVAARLANAFAAGETWDCATPAEDGMDDVDPVTRARLRALGYAD